MFLPESDNTGGAAGGGELVAILLYLKARGAGPVGVSAWARSGGGRTYPGADVGVR